MLIALQGGVKAEVDLFTIMRKRLWLSGSTLRPRSIEEKARMADCLREKVWPLLSAGRVRPVIHATFSLAEAAGAHAALEAGDHIGKIMLTL